VNMVFGSFNLHDEFFAKHQLNYLADIVRILHYTGLSFNFYDVIVMALDTEVLHEQIDKARRRLQQDPDVSLQRRLNFEMSVRNLLQSLEDRERVPKIQGLLNECMTFLDDELSVITGPYDHLLSIDEVDREGVDPVCHPQHQHRTPSLCAPLGKMLPPESATGGWQALRERGGAQANQQAAVQRRARRVRPIRIPELQPILNTARGTNTAFLFSMQSLPQLLRVGRGFKEDVTSTPNTTIRPANSRRRDRALFIARPPSSR